MLKQTDIRLTPTIDPVLSFCALFFSFTLFISASLMFMVQPMIGKMMLPIVGGAPCGWLVAMAFFQILLLGGYAFAHLLSCLPVRQHALIVLAVLIAGLLMLPVMPDANVENMAPMPSPMGIFLILASKISLPFFALSTISSSLQRLFNAAWSRAIPDPYFLFAASNLGSFFGLLAYPLWLERNYGLTMQSHGWQAGYVALIVLCGLCLTAAYKMAGSTASMPTQKILSPEISWRQRGLWIALAAAPSSLLLGITAHITVDQGSLPFFWVLPLALYLLTFVIAFAQRQLISSKYLAYVQPLVLVGFIFAFLLNPFAISSNREHIILPVLVFFLTALMCHLRLAATRPDAGKLTEFYLWVAAGGALGGSFNAFLAPYIFPLPLEFLLVALTACFLIPGTYKLSRKTFLYTLCIAAAVAGAAIFFSGTISPSGALNEDTELRSPFSIEIILTLLACYLTHPARFGHLRFRPRTYVSLAGIVITLALAEIAIADQSLSDAYIPGAVARVGLMVILGYISFWPRLFATLVPILALIAVLTHQGPHLVDIKRNFFGVWRIYDETGDKGRIKIRALYHGSTKHGIQEIAPDLKITPNGYYDVNGPLGDIFALFGPSDIGIVGIGAGTTLCYQELGRHFTVYEIDPDIVNLSSKWFDFIRLCGTPEIHIGDGRQLLRAAKGKQYDLLTVDAFSSDSIPLHLLTKEAFQIYFDRLKPDGILAIHISNRYYALEKPIGNVTRDMGLYALYKAYAPPEPDPLTQASSWVVVARTDEALAPLRHEGWRDMPPASGKVWTDDFSDAFSALNFSSFYK